VYFLYINDEQTKKDVRKIVLLTLASKKYQGINLMKEVENLYNENYKSLRKEIEKDVRRWEDFPCSWIANINIVKITVLLKEIYMVNEIPIKIPMTFFTEIEKNLSFLINSSTFFVSLSQITKAILKKRKHQWNHNN
jgi:hypothetical protein